MNYFSKGDSKMTFKLGRLVATRGVADKMQEDKEFGAFVSDSLKRYTEQDWGNLCEDDKKLSDDAIKSGDDRIMGSYEKDDHPDWRIWIITEWNRSVTTVLFPSEY